MKYKKEDITKIVKKFRDNNSPICRDSSFDYCYNYFLTTEPGDLISNMEKSCLTLGFYLASWGMVSRKSFLLKKSVKYFEPTIKYISDLDREVWKIDVDTYNEVNINKIKNIYKEVKKKIVENNHADLILVTKILMGVFGFIPAFDKNFVNTFKKIFDGRCGFCSVNKNSLECIRDFFDANQNEISRLSNEIYTFDFNSGMKTNINYPKVKIIDMYGFTKR